jgi:pimeloyl-ACP methyl ester carboxylesterase
MIEGQRDPKQFARPGRLLLSSLSMTAFAYRRPRGMAGACLVLAVAVLWVAAASAKAAPLRLGHAQLRPCHGSPGYCGSLARPLDPGLRAGPRIRIAYKWFPATDPTAPARGTIVAVEGGPGYPSTGSLSNYTGIFGAVRGRFNLLLVDNRGTGGSALIRCPSLDRFPLRRRASGPAFSRRVGACGRSLNRRYRTRTGRPVHASDLFGTAYAVADLHAVLRTLGRKHVELYGDSYGSWFAQAYAARHPDDLSAVILDSTYPIRGLDPLYASSGLVARTAMDAVCARSLACRRAAPRGTPVDRLATLLAQLRRRPIRGRAPSSPRQTVGPRQLVDLVQNAGSEAYIWRELDASVRAALGGDDVPLLRLSAYGTTNGGYADPGYFSDGAYMAVSCTDYPQLFALRAPFAQRRTQYAASVAKAPAGAFAPFTAPEWTRMSAYSEPYDACLDWPRPVRRAPVLPRPTRPLPARVPVLVVGGDLDDLTPLHDVREFAPALGARVRIVDLRNTVHVTSEGETTLSIGAACVRRIIDRFVVDPAALERIDAGCAARVPPVQTPGAYPPTLAAAHPASIQSGPARSPRVRRMVTVAAAALADATVRAATLHSDRGAGLRGGRWSRHGGSFDLRGIRFTDDTAVSGHGSYRFRDGATRGRLRVRFGDRTVTVAVAWNQRSARARATVGTTRFVLPAP